MRFKQYLIEGQLYVSKKDLPDWVKKVLKSKKIGKDIKVETTSKVYIGSNWHDANIREIFLFKNGKVASILGIGTQGPNDTKQDRTAKKGFTTKINPDEMVLVTNTKPKIAELYVHPDAMIKALEQGPVNDLSKQEILTLVIIKGLKAFARRGEAASYGIDFDSVINVLKDKKYCMKNGAINKKGKNFLLSNGYDKQIYEIADKLDIKRR